MRVSALRSNGIRGEHHALDRRELSRSAGERRRLVTAYGSCDRADLGWGSTFYLPVISADAFQPVPGQKRVRDGISVAQERKCWSAGNATAPKMAASFPSAKLAGRKSGRPPGAPCARHRKREALEWANWLMEKNADWNICRWGDRRRQTILEPFKTALDCGGIEKLCELAALIDLDMHALPRGAELTGVILGKHAPRFDLRELAADFRKSASSRVSQVPKNARARIMGFPSSDAL